MRHTCRTKCIRLPFHGPFSRGIVWFRPPDIDDELISLGHTDTCAEWLKYSPVVASKRRSCWRQRRCPPQPSNRPRAHTAPTGRDLATDRTARRCPRSHPVPSDTLARPGTRHVGRRRPPAPGAPYRSVFGPRPTWSVSRPIRAVLLRRARSRARRNRNLSTTLRHAAVGIFRAGRGVVAAAGRSVRTLSISFVRSFTVILRMRTPYWP